MARIRSIKPEFWDDRKLAKRTSRDARLLYIALWNLADEHGRLNGDPQWIKGQVFPYDDDVDAAAVARLLDELAGPSVGAVVPYEADGDPYLFLPKLARHQRLEPEKVKSRIPAPPEPEEDPSESRANKSAPRADEPGPDADESALSYVAGSMEHVPPAQERRRRGTRIPSGFAVTGEMVSWARQHTPHVDGKRETEKFINYWQAKSGRDATKLDWLATWRNWMLNAEERAPHGPAPNGRASPASPLPADVSPKDEWKYRR